jgi:hypothetical protein
MVTKALTICHYFFLAGFDGKTADVMQHLPLRQFFDTRYCI